MSWDKTRYTTRADGDGYWSVKVATPRACNTPQTISIRENRGKPVVVENVLIGEVWFCSGQSNMFMASRRLCQPARRGRRRDDPPERKV